MKKSLPRTSHDAFQQAQHFKSDHWGLILFAMRMIGVPCSMQQIADYLKWDLVRVSRRMSELLSDNCVYVNGVGLSKSNRRCQLYSLTKHAEEKQDADNTEFWKELQNEKPEPPKPQFIQTSLL